MGLMSWIGAALIALCTYSWFSASCRYFYWGAGVLGIILIILDSRERATEWYCTACGTHVPYGTRYCPNCGTMLRWEQ